jgi:signal transduction histidine kinase
MAVSKGLNFSTRLDSSLPLVISGDQKRLLQILTNLTNNAIKFTETGSVTVAIQRVDQNYWAMQVTDTGPGIPPEVQTEIFNSFWQMENSLTNKHKGYGLGLSIVQQLIDLMGGKISLKSEPGQGSTFTVTFPLEPIPPSVAEETLML